MSSSNTNSLPEQQKIKNLTTYHGYFQHELGCIHITSTESKVLSVTFCKDEIKFVEPEKPCELIAQTYQQLTEYFAGTRKKFDLPLQVQGTDFQVSVWHTLLTIPYGETTHYQALADQLGKPRGVRAVANTIGKNPLLVLVPCHRVIGKNGQLTGYAAGLAIKEKLLHLEGKLN